MRAIVLALCCLSIQSWAASSPDDLRPAFADFKSRYAKVYASEQEEAHRFNVFHQNVALAQQMMAESTHGGTAQFGVTKFMDLTQEEFSATHKGFKPPVGALDQSATVGDMIAPAVASPCSSTMCDWRDIDAITPVRDQGQCGSCWAFSATETVESAWFLAGNPIPSLSEQQLVSCDKIDQGCNGGWPPTAYLSLQVTDGQDSAESYPYVSGHGDNAPCHFNSSSIAAKVSNWTYSIEPCFGFCNHQDEVALQKAVAVYGPTSICLNARSWQFYQNGVMSSNCSHAFFDSDHCVQLVGYQSMGSGTNSYWIVRNSWGTDWGVAGFIYLEIGLNLCGLANQPTIVNTRK